MLKTTRQAINIKDFHNIDNSEMIKEFVDFLEYINQVNELQQLKRKSYELSHIKSGLKILDVGCGIGLETVCLAKMVGNTGKVTGIEISKEFLKEANNRCANIDNINLQHGDAHQLPFAANEFDVSRAERLFLYLQNPKQALSEMLRVTKPGGYIYLIEPDWDTLTFPIQQREITRKILHYECDHTVTNGWIGRQLRFLFRDAGINNISITTTTIQYEPFERIFLKSKAALEANIITPAEAESWDAEAKMLLEKGELICTGSYFLAVGQKAC